MTDIKEDAKALLNIVSYIRSESARLQLEDAPYFAELLSEVIVQDSGLQTVGLKTALGPTPTLM